LPPRWIRPCPETSAARQTPRPAPAALGWAPAGGSGRCPDQHCWGLGLWEISGRLIPASKTSPNLSAGPRWLGDKCARRMIGAFQNLRSVEEITFGRVTEGDKSSLKSTSSKTRACEAARWSPSGDRRRQLITQEHKLEDQSLRRISTPEGC